MIDGCILMRLLAAESNEKGDLLGRLVTDFFLAQGYEDFRLAIHKTGREVDVKARHRIERRRTIAECKATAAPVGGADLNKFAGVVQVEREAIKGEELQAYCISLSGFRESAIEQEEELSSPRFILLDGENVQNELVAGGMVVSPERACEAAGRLAADISGISLQGSPRLLGHEIGWIWLCEYAANRQPTHFALIHADGTPLNSSLADRIVTADRDVNGSLEALEYLAPPDTSIRMAVDEAGRRYREYLLTELGEITLEGLPADQEAGSRRIALEDLYVPLKVVSAPDRQDRGAESVGRSIEVVPDVVDVSEEEEGLFTSWEPDGEDAEDESVGAVLGRERRIAVLAPPGAGKSTLIKRLAVAYASPENRGKIADDLPDVDWLPVFLRCRSLGRHCRDPILKILEHIPHRGEFPECTDGFRELVTNALVSGRVLLLIDGLDEISEPGDRLAFILQLRTFLSTYPNAALVLTSREAGFRAVGGAVSSICGWYHLAEFDNEDINRLTRAWHATVVGDSATVDRDATVLAEKIVATDRVRRLASNPLLLTTLLLVKRWVGELPRKRSVLYEKAIEVLLMTWNVEAHEPIDRDEAIPQLAFVAHSLTERGEQSLSATTLAELLSKARKQMPDILEYARATVKQFVEQVESRSSLLTMTGHTEENGNLVPIYEFRHLTFQEYLTAVALVEGYYEDHEDDDRLIDRLDGHLRDPRWFEVVALTNVQAGRSARAVVSRLLELAESDDSSAIVRDLPNAPSRSVRLLARSLADEVQLPPQLVEEVSQVVAIKGITDLFVAEILEARYGDAFRATTRDLYMADPARENVARTLVAVTLADMESISLDDPTGMDKITKGLEAEAELTVAEAALRAMLFAFENGANGKSIAESHPAWSVLEKWSGYLIEWCEKGEPYVVYATTWALAWLGHVGAIQLSDRVRGLKALLNVWRSAATPEDQHRAAWAFVSVPEVDREMKPFGNPSSDLCEFVEEQGIAERRHEDLRDDRVLAAAVLAYYMGGPWDDKRIAAVARAAGGPSTAKVSRLIALDPRADVDD